LDGSTQAVDVHGRQQPIKPHLAKPANVESRWIEAVGGRGFSIRAALSQDERSSASSLIHRMYAGRGYKTTPLSNHANDDRVTLVATAPSSVVGTLTIGFDSADRLLVDELFPDEVSAIRMSGRQVCEFTKLAVDSSVRSQRVLAAMFHVAFIHAHRIRGCDNLLIEVNPRHVWYYEVKLGFRVLSSQRMNPRVDAPAVLLSLDLWHAQEQICQFGGRPELSGTERSLYPYALATEDEAIIADRLAGRPRVAERSALAAMA
jgi:hypothetical protein